MRKQQMQQQQQKNHPNDTLNDSVDSPVLSASNSDTDLSNASNDQSMEEIGTYKEDAVERPKAEQEQESDHQPVQRRNARLQKEETEGKEDEQQGVKKRLSKKLSSSTENLSKCNTQTSE
jgi:hypothetical protein